VTLAPPAAVPALPLVAPATLACGSPATPAAEGAPASPEEQATPNAALKNDAKIASQRFKTSLLV
jgi:hypothetical protein